MAGKILCTRILITLLSGFFFTNNAMAKKPDPFEDLNLKLNAVSQQIEELQSDIDSLDAKVDILINDAVNPDQVSHWIGFPYEERVVTQLSPNGDPNGVEFSRTDIHIFNPGIDSVHVTVQVFSSFGTLFNTFDYDIPGITAFYANGIWLDTCEPDPLTNNRTCQGYVEITASAPVVPSGVVRGTVINAASMAGESGVVSRADAFGLTWMPRQD